MAQRLDVLVDEIHGRRPLTLEVTRVYNLGFTIRDQAKMQRHVEEMALAGITAPAPRRPPTIFPISPWTTVVDDEAIVQFDMTNGEVEIAVVERGDEVLVGVASDHTDRQLEKTSLPWSKQVAPNVLAPVLWRWEDVREHWDEVVIESYVGDGTKRERYQRAAVAEFWTPVEMLESVVDRIMRVPGDRVFLSGTVVSDSGILAYGPEWTLVMHDPVLERTIEHVYRVVVLHDEISD